MDDNEEHLCFMLFLDNYVQKEKRKTCVKKYFEVMTSSKL